MYENEEKNETILNIYIYISGVALTQFSLTLHYIHI